MTIKIRIIRAIIKWLIKKFLPGFHLHVNPSYGMPKRKPAHETIEVNEGAGMEG